MARAMKDSGIEWIGEIPANWECVPIRSLFKEVSRKNIQGLVTKALKFTYGEIVPKIDFEADEDDYVANTIQNYTIVEPGTIMLNGLNLNFDFVTRRIGLVKEQGVITSAYMAFKPIDSQKMMPEYAAYLLKSYDHCKAFHNMGGGVRKILNFSELKHQYVLCPRMDIQILIVAFLDKKCAEIDALMANVQAQIETLEQYKRSVITEAVTKGLNPNVPMKDSGITCIGSIPLSWRVSRFKYHATVKANLVQPEGYEDFPQIAPDNIEKNTGKLMSYGTVEESGIISGNHLFHKGQILYSKIRPNLNKAIIAPFDGLCSADMYPIETVEHTTFILYLMLSNYFVEQVSLVIRDRVKMPKINQDELGQIRVVIPCMIEQKQITAYLDTKCAEIDAIIDGKRQQLAVLEEYKKSIIFEYVTGKKEVPVA